MSDARDERITSLTISNLRVWQIGDILTLLQDNGYEVEINLDKDYSPGNLSTTQRAQVTAP